MAWVDVKLEDGADEEVMEEDLERTRRRQERRVPMDPAESHWQEKRR